MAEQVHHNVVNQLESTSGSAPLVDVATNYNNIASALIGAQTSSNDQTAVPSSYIEPSSSANAGNPLAPSIQSANTASEAFAEPSAGNAAAERSVDSILEDGDKTANGLLQPEFADDPALIDTSADPSVNSDTDTSRADGAEQARDEAQHGRTNSIKKPTTFSRVAVTKNFLAKSISPASASASPKPGDKTSPSTIASPAALRPRLVAKTAATLSNLSRTRLGTDSTNGPEAGTVWNKNRPTPSMPPKQFTDEELKQQYGIHLATRLQSDDAGKGSKWADIDDDEDDWAPEAVEWMDGTKSTLNPTETTTVPAQQVATSVPSDKASDAIKPSLILGKSTSQSLNSTRAVLKPGAATQAKQHGNATAGTTASEKQILIAKSPASSPAKSPWAPLPPVDKISPINPPVQVQTRYQPPFSSQDARAGDFSTPSVSAREIAADTFDRSWHVADGETRELFNSASGKYEPAPEGRRNSIRHDGARKHAVLRRPSHGVNTAEHPANLHGNVPWSHRRGSSASQASSFIQRPLSVAQSTHSQGVLSTGTGPDRDGSNHALASGASAWVQQLPPPPTNAADGQAEDPIKAQERVMREKREAARRRRQEEEAQEEQAKQARLKAKLEALAGAGLSRKERQQASTLTSDAEAAVANSNASAPQTQPTDSDKQNQEAIAASVVIDDADKQAEVLNEAAQPHALSPNLQDASITEPSPRLTQREQVASSAASRSTFQSQVSGSYQTGPSSAFSSPGDRERKPQPFARSAIQNHDNFSSPWPSTGSSNVWGGKGIGNGTFESAFAPLSSHHQALSLPPPPGMGRAGTTNRISPQTLGSSATHSPTLQDAQVADHRRPLPASELDSVPDHFNPQARIASLTTSQGMGRQQHVPGPIGPPSRTQAQAQQPASRAEQVSAWQAASQQLPNQYTADASSADRLRHEEVPADARRLTNRFVGTFKQTGTLGGPRKYERIEHTVSEDGLGTNAPFGVQPHTHPSTQSSISLDLVGRASESNVRLPDASRSASHGAPGHHQSVRARGFLPPHLRGNSGLSASTAVAPGDRADDDLPPPPETTSHPVFEGDHYRPNVRLPPPPAVVKLPPSAMSVQHNAPHSMLAQRGAQNFGHGSGARPIVQNEAWQARFNGLFNRTPIQTETPPSPPKTPPKSFAASPALAIASSTRAAIDVSGISGPTVSIPRLSKAGNKSAEGFTLDSSTASTSKHMVQSMFTEELGFGSRPSVRIPRDVSPGSSNLAHINLLAVRPNPKDYNNIIAQTGPEVSAFLFYKKLDAYFVKLPGSTKNKVIYATRNSNKLHVSKRNKPAGLEKSHSGTHKATTASPNDTAKSSAPLARSGTSSRKTSTLKANAAASSPDVQSENKSDTPTQAAKSLRKRSSHHKQAVKSAVAAEKSSPTAVKSA